MLFIDCLHQPMFIFGITLLVSMYWLSVELSVLTAVITGLFVLMISSSNKVEHYCSEYRNRWCPEKDFCIPDEDKEGKIMNFLDDTDKFIKEMYDFVRPDDPAYVVDMGTPKIEGTPYNPASKPTGTPHSSFTKYWISGLLSCCCAIIIAIFVYTSMRKND